MWENLDLGRVYRPRCVRSVLATSVKILPYRSPARLIRAKYDTFFSESGADTGGVDRVDFHPPFFSKKKFEMSLYLK